MAQLRAQLEAERAAREAAETLAAAAAKAEAERAAAAGRAAAEKVAAAERAAAAKADAERAAAAAKAASNGWVVSTLAGSGAKGFADGARAVAQFNKPFALAPLPDGSVVVADTDNHCIRLIAASGCSVSMLAGEGGEKGFADGAGAAARFCSPRGVVVGVDGAIFVADAGNHCIRRIKDGAVTTFAGSGEAGGADGVGAAASFCGPYGLALGPGGVLYVTEYGGHRVRVISPAGAVTMLAGGGGSGFTDGRGAAARFRGPAGIAIDAAGVVFVADLGNHRIRRIMNGTVETFAGSGEKGFAEGAGAVAQFFYPCGLAVDPATGNLLVSDTSNHRIRAVDSHSGAVSTLAGSGAKGSADGNVAAASFSRPEGVAVDAQGVILVSDTDNNRVRRIARA